jgi:hypothetical protein
MEQVVILIILIHLDALDCLDHLDYPQGEPSLKAWLVGSRALAHQPQYAATHARISTAREEVLGHAIIMTHDTMTDAQVVLELVAGLAAGLAHLERVGLAHGGLCARSVVMVGDRAKIAGLGMAAWARPGERPDCSRWLVINCYSKYD